MLWIKRNLFLAVGGLVTLLLLGGGGFLLMAAIEKNKTVEAEAEQVMKTRDRLYKMKPYPASSNVVAGEAKLEELQRAVSRSQAFFQPVPFQSVSNFEFKTLLDNTVAMLQHRASEANTILPSRTYSFSFQAEKEALSLPPYSFPTLPMQLAEVTVIANVLFDSKINALDSLRRPRVSGQEPGQEDYHALRPTTNLTTQTISTPYEVSFYGFSANLAQILEAFYQSDYGIVVKAVATTATAGLSREPGGAEPERMRGPARFTPPPPRGRQFNRSDELDAFEGEDRRPQRPPPPQFARPRGPAAPSGPQTVLDENLLRIDLLIYMIRPNPTT